MTDDLAFVKRWVLLGIVSGLAISLLYPATFLVQNLTQGVILASAMGPALALASVGLYHFLNFHRKQISSQIGGIANVIAGTLLTTMLLVQLAIVASKPETVDLKGNWTWITIHHIHYGLDVAWDIFLFIGTLCFSLSMFRHPGFGRPFAISGLVIAVTFIVFNLYTFPIPPGGGGLIDLGPIIALWYLAVTIRLIVLYRRM
jgi:hypothetical protein